MGCCSVAESRGSRKGVIVELDKAVAAIQKAVEAAEDVAGAAVEHAIVGIGGAHVRGVNSHGGISLGTRPREIGRDEIKQAVERARAIPLPADREVLAFAAAGGGLFALAGLDFYVFANATKPERTST